MPSSDSEDFESADEGHFNIDKKERKKRLSSSNYSDNALETDQDHKDKPISASNVQKFEENVKQETDGWDDFDIDENEPETPQAVMTSDVSKEKNKPQIKPAPKQEQSQDTGWGDFGDWGQDSSSAAVQDQQPKPRSSQPDQDMKTVADRLAAVSTEPASSGWGWGWSVDSLLSTASAGISTLTSQVSQGISTVLESGIGAPDPEELARIKATKSEGQDAQSGSPDKPPKEVSETHETKGNVSEGQFPFGSLISGVTKFVETTGTKVISGGLDTLETIGKKTMEVLQDGDPGLAKKRALLGLDSGDKPVLSQVLREAKARADEEDNVREQKREAKEVHYENLFDDFEGLVHLEALEMLSRQVRLRIDERLRGAEPSKRQDINETLHQVAELCEMPEEDDDDEEPQDGSSKSEAFHERLQTATQDLGLKLQFQPLVKQYDEVSQWVSQSSDGARGVYKRAVSALAQTTALCMEVYHKAAEMLLVKPRRSTADEADALTQMTVVLTKHISELATLFTEKLNSLPDDDKDQISNYTTNIFLEAGNSSTYIQNAFQLILPILQIGAV